MNKLFLPYDVYERHKRVAEFIKEDETVLDVGGELNHLSQFIKPKRIVVANLSSGDVIITKNKLPFTSNSFDTVCAIDVLEHVQKKDRAKFLNQLMNVAGRKVILSFPIGTEKHTNYEKKMLKYLKEKKIDFKYLEEHVKNGLPKIEDIENFSKGKNFRIYYSGNIKLNEILFKLFIFDPRIKVMRRIIYYSKITFNALTNNLLYALLSNKAKNDNINRAYLIISK